MRWFRFYDEALDDPKVQNLSPVLFKTWLNLLCVASRNKGKLGPIEHLAFSLRTDVDSLGAQVQELINIGLLDAKPSLRPHNWEGRQYKSDDHAERMRRHRKRQRDATCDVTGDHPEQKQIQKQNRTEKKESVADAPGFSEFWDVFPHRPGDPRKTALRAYANATGTPEVILAGARRFAARVRQEGTDPKFIPMAATWLNQERWTQEPAAPTRKPFAEGRGVII